MDLLLSEEEAMIKNGAREFFEAECPPSLARAMESDPLGYSPELWQKMADLGWLGLALPEQYGGQGLPLTYLGILFEEAGRAIAPVPLHSTIVPALTIAADGTEQQRSDILPRVIQGDLILTWAVTEADPRFVPESVHAEAVAEGDGFVISGTKRFVENVEAAGMCLVLCRTSPASAENEGLSLFLVDTRSPGISTTPLVTIARDKQSNVTFERVRVPAGNLVGRLNEGWAVARPMIERATALLCAQLLGASRMQAEMAIEYAKGRTAFGRPIGAFQSIAHACADMIIWIDGGGLLTYEALWRMDQGLPASIEVAQAKAFCNDKCMATGRMSNQIHGGIAFMREFNLNLWFRRIAAMTMKLGTSFEHRAQVAAALIDQPGQVRLGEDMYNLTAKRELAVAR
jgi:alkylation response protein AidB-like acyl-CoA dehydrogenase